MKKIIGITLSAMMSFSLLAGCSNNDNNDAATDFTVDTINVTYVQAPLNVPSIVEREKGMFEEAFSEHDISVEYSNLTTGPEQTAALASGDIQFLFAVGATSVIQAASNGSDIKIISTYSRSPEAFMLFSNDDTITSAADLEGKTIAGPTGTILHELLVAYLDTAGLTIDDVNFVSMDITESQAALENGSVDLALLAGTAAYHTEQSGTHVVTTGEGLVDATIVVATSESFYNENPSLVELFLDTQNDILDFIDENTDEAIEITAEVTELSIEAVEDMYPMYDFSSEITDEDIESMKNTVQFMLDNDMIENDVNIEDLILDLQG